MGVPVGTVGKKGDIRVSVDLKNGDVLEIRGKDEKEVLQWTIRQPVPKGGICWPEIHRKSRLMPGMTAFRMRNPSLIEELEEEHVRPEMKEKIYGRLRVVKDSPVILTLKWKDIFIRLEGERAEAAKNQPMSEEKLMKPIGKTGNTPFIFEK